MSSSDWKRGERCGIEGCRSRRYKVADDGLTYCQNGHQQLEKGFIFGDDDYITPATKKTKRSQEEDEERPPRYATGPALAHLYLQCFQLVLRKQIWFLVHDLGYSQELETVVRSLWALRMQMLAHLLTEPDANQVFTSRTSSIRTRSASDPSLSDPEAPSSTSYKSQILDEMQYKRLPRLVESVTILYVALVLQHQPVSVNDVRTWIFTPGFVYLRAIEAIPFEMKQSINPQRLHTFHARAGCPDRDRLYFEMLHMCAIFSKKCAISIPPINHVLLLNKHIQSLGLPLDAFEAVRVLSRIFAIDFRFPDMTRRKSLGFHPEAQLISLIIIAVKILYPFDDVERHPSSIDEPATLRLPWKEWRRFQTEAEGKDTLAGRNEKMLSLTEDDALHMKPSEMDEYLQWYQTTWTTSTKGDSDQSGNFNRILEDIFTVCGSPGQESGPPSQAPCTGNLGDEGAPDGPVTFQDQVLGSVEQVEPIAEGPDDIARPGSFYRQYRRIEDLSPDAHAFFAAAANLVALDLVHLVQAVSYWEKRLRRIITRGANNADQGGDDERDALAASHAHSSDQGIRPLDHDRRGLQHAL